MSKSTPARRLNDFQIRHLAEQVSATVMSRLGVEQVTATVTLSKAASGPNTVAYDITVLINGQKPTDEQSLTIAEIIAPITANALQFVGAN